MLTQCRTHDRFTTPAVQSFRNNRRANPNARQPRYGFGHPNPRTDNQIMRVQVGFTEVRNAQILTCPELKLIQLAARPSEY